MKKIETIHFNGFDANVAELAEIIPKIGFRPLAGVTEADLPSGSVIMTFSQKNKTLGIIVICEHVHNGFTFMIYNELNNEPSIEYMNQKYDFDNYLYKVLFQLPNVNPNQPLEELRAILANVGFKSLDEATPADLPQGCIALLASRFGTVSPVIVRVLSMENRRFLYLHQGIVAGEWHSKVLMNKLKPFKNYLYLVIS